MIKKKTSVVFDLYWQHLMFKNNYLKLNKVNKKWKIKKLHLIKGRFRFLLKIT